MGKMEHQGFRQLNTSPKKNFGFRHIPHSQSREYCSFSLSNIQKLYGVLWVTDPSFPPFTFLFLHVYSHFHFNGSPLASRKFKDSAFHRSRIVEIEGHKKKRHALGEKGIIEIPSQTKWIADSVLNASSSTCTEKTRPEEELGGKDKGTLELANAISWVWLYLPLHLLLTDRAYCGYLVIQPFSPWPSTNEYMLQHLSRAFLMTNLTTSLFLFPRSHGVGQTKTSTSLWM